MPAVLRLHGAAADDHALSALVALGATQVETDGRDLLGLHPDDGAGLLDRLPAGLHGAIEAARFVDWDSVWWSSVRPVRVASLTLGPVGHPELPVDALALEAGRAFGSACHATTRLCLEWLEHRVPRGGSLLDLGTGTGVLGLAALRWGAGSVLGTDTDPEALAVAARNATRAGLPLQLRAQVPDGARFDRVVANLLASSVIELAPWLVRWLGPAGELAVSGFGPARVADVEAALRRVGLRVVGGDTREGWSRVDCLAPW